jgi:hypothetical protein
MEKLGRLERRKNYILWEKNVPSYCGRARNIEFMPVINEDEYSLHT